jgi:hypothetical protein
MKLANLNLEYLDNWVSSIIQVPYGSYSTLFEVVPPLTLSTFPRQLEGQLMRIFIHYATSLYVFI